VRVPKHTLPTGIPVPSARPDGATRSAFRQRFGIAPDRPVALFVGRVAHEKNLGFLLDAIELARVDKPDLLLLVAGEGPALPSLQRSVATRGLQANVQFIGYLDRRSELPACYAAADVFVFASRTETQGLVLLEAMAAGLPVVALAKMGTCDILDAGRGARVPDDHPCAFAQALLRLLGDDRLRAQLGEQARAYAREWSDDTLAGRLAELYRALVVQGSRPLVLDLKLSAR
jgi:1,2-diacylglycerol 3-alpha-glucosyltransferase